MVSGLNVGENGYFRSRRGATALGLAYLLVGIGLLVALVGSEERSFSTESGGLDNSFRRFSA